MSCDIELTCQTAGATDVDNCCLSPPAAGVPGAQAWPVHGLGSAPVVPRVSWPEDQEGICMQSLAWPRVAGCWVEN